MRKDNDLGKDAWKSISPMSVFTKILIAIAITGLIIVLLDAERRMGDYTAKYQKQQANEYSLRK